MTDLLPTLVAAVAAIVGVVAGGWLARGGEHRRWLDDRRLAAYSDLLRHYALFSMELRRAHAARRGWDHPWGEWSAALTTASLVAPAAVAAEIDRFGLAVDAFLDATARGRDTRTDALDAEAFDAAARTVGAAQLTLVNAMRRSLDRGQRPLATWLGGTPVR